MSTIALPRAGPQLLQAWRQQVSGQRRRREACGARPYAAIGYLNRGPAYDGLVDVRRLLLVVLRDDRHADGSLATLLTGYGIAVVPWGAQIGGKNLCRIEKDLTLAPKLRGRSRRFDLADAALLTRALDLDRHLERHLNYPNLPRRREPRLPQLWAGFAPSVAAAIRREGPEYEAARRISEPIVERAAAGLTLLPLEFVGHAWQQILALFVDLKTFPKRQVLKLDDRARNLSGFSRATQYDFYHSRFSSHVV